MITRQVILNVKYDYDLPLVYTKNNIEEIEEALWIGATIQNSIKTRRSNDEIRKITELKDSEIQRIQTMYQEKLTKLLDDIRTITLDKDRITTEYNERLKEAQQVERDTNTRDFEEKMRILRKEYEILSSRYDALESGRRLLEESRAKDIQEAVNRTQELMEKVISSKQDQLNKMESAYQRLQESIHKQSDEISKLSSTITKRGSNVKTKGSDYEEQFAEKLRRYFGLCRGFKLKDTRLGSGHEMDFSMEIDNHIIMWELKNYTSTVPKAEVDKFLRDLKENSQTNIGVMISRSTDIYGKYHSGSMLTEFDGDKMMIYINKFEEFCGDDESRIFQMLTSIFRIWWEYHREENKIIDTTELVHELEKAIEDILKRRTEWRRHKSHLDEISRWTTNLLDESENRLDRILKRIKNNEEKTDDNIIIPDGIFRDTTEQKDISWIKSIMSVCGVGGEIEVRELVELLSSHHKLSKDTIRSNVMSVMKDSSVFKKGVIKYIKGISKFIPPSKINLSIK